MDNHWFILSEITYQIEMGRVKRTNNCVFRCQINKHLCPFHRDTGLPCILFSSPVNGHKQSTLVCLSLHNKFDPSPFFLDIFRPILLISYIQVTSFVLKRI